MLFNHNITQAFMGRALLWLLFMFPLAVVSATTADTYPTGKNNAALLPDSSDQCCAYAIHLVNLYHDQHIKSVRVTGICATNMCCADSDGWEQESDLPESVEWSPGGGAGLPYGNAIDNDFMVYLDKATSPHTIQIEFVDEFGNVVCRQIISITCDGPFQEDEDWMKYTSRTALDDPNLFAFATREDEDDDEGDCEWGTPNAMIVPCVISASVTCSGGNTYVVTINGASGFDQFTWQVEQGPTSPALGNTQFPTYTTNQSGSYVISMMAVNTSTKDTCTNEIEVIIPKFDPDFSWTILPCTQGIKFTAAGWDDPSDISGVSWSCSTIPGFPTSGGQITSANPGAGSYNVTMTITDKYGCSHSITKTVTISTTCNPGLKVEEFTFCPSDCTGPTVNKIVTFRNTSTGGICPITYKIDYGDGTPIVIKHEYDSIMTHAYNVSCPNGQSFNVTMTMIDSGTPVRCTTTTSIVAKIEPCNVDFDIEVCPDGRVNFEANMKGKWDLTGKIAKAPWPYSSFAVNGKRQRVVARYGNGTHTVSFTGTCDGAGKCTVTKTFTVLLECCAKNDRTKDDHRFTVGTTDYKMKYRFAQNQMPLVHNLRAITKLKKKKTKWGISFWKGDKADNIAASIDGTIYRRDADKCNCAIADSVSKAESLPNKKKIKAKKGSMGRFRSRVDSVTSTHEVRVGGTVETRQLKLGKDCDVFRWWTDWY